MLGGGEDGGGGGGVRAVVIEEDRDAHGAKERPLHLLQQCLDLLSESKSGWCSTARLYTPSSGAPPAGVAFNAPSGWPLDQFCDAMIQIAREAETVPDVVHEAPVTTPVRRLDQTKAAREPDLRWTPRG